MEPKPAAVLAVLDQRLRPTHDQPHPDTHVAEGAQISKRMRLIYIAPQHNEFVYSGYPSESFLAEAGTHALYAWRKSYGRTVVETLGYVIKTIISTQESLLGGSSLCWCTTMQ